MPPWMTAFPCTGAPIDTADLDAVAPTETATSKTSLIIAAHGGRNDLSPGTCESARASAWRHSYDWLGAECGGGSDIGAECDL